MFVGRAWQNPFRFLETTRETIAYREHTCPKAWVIKVAYRLILALSLRLVFAGCMKSILDCLYKGRLRPILVVCASGASSALSSSAMVSLADSSREFLARARASSTILARVARMECIHPAPFASETPRASLSRRFEGGTGPLKGVSKCEGKASRVYRSVAIQ